MKQQGLLRCSVTSGCLRIEDGNGAHVRGLRVCVRIASSSHPCPSQLAQGAHHVEQYVCLAGLIEMQIVPHNNVRTGRQESDCDSAEIRRDRWLQRTSAGG